MTSRQIKRALADLHLQFDIATTPRNRKQCEIAIVSLEQSLDAALEAEAHEDAERTNDLYGAEPEMSADDYADYEAMLRSDR